ncbi:uncharacterized protein CDAR_306081 [Caerostris darwini]|uniref:Uncharacterized protein n=1 Tax=Caerostris darwini TaxID=1538125 RepID=A0AAV4PNX3_9ARAC|nr:uncharacterized protein CDAR_306081 [Caerostris darwini]
MRSEQVIMAVSISRVVSHSHVWDVIDRQLLRQTPSKDLCDLSAQVNSALKNTPQKITNNIINGVQNVFEMFKIQKFICILILEGFMIKSGNFLNSGEDFRLAPSRSRSRWSQFFVIGPQITGKRQNNGYFYQVDPHQSSLNRMLPLNEHAYLHKSQMTNPNNLRNNSAKFPNSMPNTGFQSFSLNRGFQMNHQQRVPIKQNKGNFTSSTPEVTSANPKRNGFGFINRVSQPSSINAELLLQENVKINKKAELPNQRPSQLNIKTEPVQVPKYSRTKTPNIPELKHKEVGITLRKTFPNSNRRKSCNTSSCLNDSINFPSNVNTSEIFLSNKNSRIQTISSPKITKRMFSSPFTRNAHHYSTANDSAKVTIKIPRRSNENISQTFGKNLKLRTNITKSEDMEYLEDVLSNGPKVTRIFSINQKKNSPNNMFLKAPVQITESNQNKLLRQGSITATTYMSLNDDKYSLSNSSSDFTKTDALKFDQYTENPFIIDLTTKPLFGRRLTPLKQSSQVAKMKNISDSDFTKTDFSETQNFQTSKFNKEFENNTKRSQYEKPLAELNRTIFNVFWNPERLAVNKEYDITLLKNDAVQQNISKIEGGNSTVKENNKNSKVKVPLVSSFISMPRYTEDKTAFHSRKEETYKLENTSFIKNKPNNLKIVRKAETSAKNNDNSKQPTVISPKSYSSQQISTEQEKKFMEYFPLQPYISEPLSLKLSPSARLEIYKTEEARKETEGILNTENKSNNIKTIGKAEKGFENNNDKLQSNHSFHSSPSQQVKTQESNPLKSFHSQQIKLEQERNHLKPFHNRQLKIQQKRNPLQSSQLQTDDTESYKLKSFLPTQPEIYSTESSPNAKIKLNKNLRTIEKVETVTENNNNNDKRKPDYRVRYQSFHSRQAEEKQENNPLKSFQLRSEDSSFHKSASNPTIHLTTKSNITKTDYIEKLKNAVLKFKVELLSIDKNKTHENHEEKLKPDVVHHLHVFTDISNKFPAYQSHSYYAPVQQYYIPPSHYHYPKYSYTPQLNSQNKFTLVAPSFHEWQQYERNRISKPTDNVRNPLIDHSKTHPDETIFSENQEIVSSTVVSSTIPFLENANNNVVRAMTKRRLEKIREKEDTDTTPIANFRDSHNQMFNFGLAGSFKPVINIIAEKRTEVPREINTKERYENDYRKEIKFSPTTELLLNSKTNCSRKLSDFSEFLATENANSESSETESNNNGCHLATNSPTAAKNQYDLLKSFVTRNKTSIPLHIPSENKIKFKSPSSLDTPYTTIAYPERTLIQPRIKDTTINPETSNTKINNLTSPANVFEDIIFDQESIKTPQTKYSHYESLSVVNPNSNKKSNNTESVNFRSEENEFVKQYQISGFNFSRGATLTQNISSKETKVILSNGEDTESKEETITPSNSSIKESFETPISNEFFSDIELTTISEEIVAPRFTTIMSVNHNGTKDNSIEITVFKNSENKYLDNTKVPNVFTTIIPAKYPESKNISIYEFNLAENDTISLEDINNSTRSEDESKQRIEIEFSTEKAINENMLLEYNNETIKTNKTINTNEAINTKETMNMEELHSDKNVILHNEMNISNKNVIRQKDTTPNHNNLQDLNILNDSKTISTNFQVPANISIDFKNNSLLYEMPEIKHSRNNWKNDKIPATFNESTEKGLLSSARIIKVEKLEKEKLTEINDMINKQIYSVNTTESTLELFIYQTTHNILNFDESPLTTDKEFDISSISNSALVSTTATTLQNDLSSELYTSTAETSLKKINENQKPLSQVNSNSSILT